MELQTLKNIIEAALCTSDKPLSLGQLTAIFDDDEQDFSIPSQQHIKKVLILLQADYESRGLELIEVASGYRIQAKKDYSKWIGRLRETKPPRYSRAVLETLSLIAYRQPITRSEIEDVRGVSVSSNIIRSLLEREWIKVIGHREVPGRPALFSTTKQFLDYFNLVGLSDLPSLPEIKELIDPQANKEIEQTEHDSQSKTAE